MINGVNRNPTTMFTPSAAQLLRALTLRDGLLVAVLLVEELCVSFGKLLFFMNRLEVRGQKLDFR